MNDVGYIKTYWKKIWSSSNTLVHDRETPFLKREGTTKKYPFIHLLEKARV